MTYKFEFEYGKGRGQSYSFEHDDVELYTRYTTLYEGHFWYAALYGAGEDAEHIVNELRTAREKAGVGRGRVRIEGIGMGRVLHQDIRGLTLPAEDDVTIGDRFKISGDNEPTGLNLFDRYHHGDWIFPAISYPGTPSLHL